MEGQYSGIWRKLRKNKTAMFSMAIILLTLIISICAYLVAPDSSPFANRMIPELANRKPGFQMQALKLRKDIPVPETSFFQRLVYGREDSYHYIPVTNYQIINDSITISKYIDEGVTELQTFALSQTAPDPVGKVRFTLGSDRFGRDIASRLIAGSRVSISVGFIAVLVSLSIGIILGALAGYYRGRIDNIIMWLINVIWSIPTLLLVFAVTLALGKGFWQVFIAIGLTMWVNVARLVRGQVIAAKEQEYVEAAKALGFSGRRIIIRHILPNILGPVIVIAASNFASAILVEAGLSFLGVGIQPPQPSWGLMIKENYNFIITNNPTPALAPGVTIMLLVLAFNLLGNSLRDAFNVRTGL